MQFEFLARMGDRPAPAPVPGTAIATAAIMLYSSAMYPTGTIILG